MRAIGLNIILDVTDYFDSLKPKETKTASGIIIPSVVKKETNEKTIEGKIVSLSNKAKKETDLKEGDIVVISKFFGNRYEKDYKTYAILDYNLILAKKE